MTARSVCVCGHTGDGTDSEHETIAAPGHGKCTQCACDKFTWLGFMPAEGEEDEDDEDPAEDEDYHGSEAEKGDIPNPATGSID